MADKPQKRPPPPPPLPVWSWTGGYLGLNLGGSWGSSSFAETFINSLSGGTLFYGNGSINNINGVIGGGQAGYI